MCKILCLTTHKPAKRDSIIETVWRLMATTEKDGFGAAWFSPSGELGFYRSSRPVIPSGKALPRFVSGFAGANPVESDGGFLIIHGRTATCGVSLENTHPMLADNAALVHNGVVSSDTHDNETSSCDSELLLRAWLHGGMDEVAASVSGYFAFMLLQKVGSHKRLHVVKDSTANLYAGEYGPGYAFATTTPLLQGVKATVLGEVQDNTHTAFAGPTQHRVKGFKPRAFTSGRFEFAARAAFAGQTSFRGGFTAPGSAAAAAEVFEAADGAGTDADTLAERMAEAADAAALKPSKPLVDMTDAEFAEWERLQEAEFQRREREADATDDEAIADAIADARFEAEQERERRRLAQEGSA